MKIRVEIQGVTPLIMNRFTDEAALAASKGSGTAMSTADRGTPIEQCERKLYRDQKGQICIPQPNLLLSIVGGGAFVKAGKKQITTARSSLLFGGLTIDGTTIPLRYKQPWKVDTRPVRIPATGGRILCHRPMFDDWSLLFEIDIDIDMFGAKLIREIFDHAGKKIGLGDYRPATKGPYGRYVVGLWKEMKEEIPRKLVVAK